MEAESSENRPSKAIQVKNPREAAYLAVLTAIREDVFVADLLDEWKEISSPSPADFGLAREIAFGVTRMALGLDYVAESLADRQKLKLKTREKVLLRTAIYQHYYMDRVPLYAITNETIDIAKKHCHESFTRFMNAILRRLSEEQPELPEGDTVPEMSIRYSYPAYFVQEVVQNYGLERAIAIMEAGNKAAPVMCRIRPQAKGRPLPSEGMELLAGTLSSTAVVKDPALLPDIANSVDYYIQNVTPVELISALAKEAVPPKRILDLCSSPGGKLIAVHDIFEDAELVANDVSARKLRPLSENLAKYAIAATVSCSKGESFTDEVPFDLVVLDVPCSNSGVLNKRPEARWRISQKSVEQLEQLQLQLIKNAASLITDEGEIWYMTCSILKRENGRLIEKACELLNLQVRTKERVLPNLDGWDGGFACALQKKA